MNRCDFLKTIGFLHHNTQIRESLVLEEAESTQFTDLIQSLDLQASFSLEEGGEIIVSANAMNP